MLRLELASLQLDYDVTPELEVVEEQVEEEVIASNLDMDLPPDVSKARTELQEEFRDVSYQRLLNLTLFGLFAQCEEVESVRVLE